MYEESELVSRPKTYHYFISYVYVTSKGPAFGWADSTLGRPIRGSRDIEMLVDHFKTDLDADSVTILGWQRFEGDRT